MKPAPRVEKNKTLCLFSSYFLTPKIPGYIKYYLTSLKKNCDQVILIKNNCAKIDSDSIAWLKSNYIDLFYVENEGLDFGMWKKTLLNYNGQKYDTLCLCNDSCVLFKSLNDTFSIFRKNKFQAFGLVKSHEFNEHLQSYFLLFEGEAKEIAIKYILSLDLASKTYDEVVHAGEIGLSSELIKNKITLNARFEPTASPNENPSFIYCEQLIKDGMPMIKRKALGYPPGYLLKKYILSRKGIPKNYFIAQIRLSTNYDPEATLFFKDIKKRSILSEIQLARRYARFYIQRIISDLKVRNWYSINL